MRGHDVPNAPLPLSFALLMADGAVEWFAEPAKVPAELRRHLAAGGLRLTQTSGVSLDPLARDWRLSADRSVNYLAFAVKDEAA